MKAWRCLPRWDRWFAIPFMFVFFALVGWIPDIYVRATGMPPFEQLQRTSGVISFEKAGRSGWVTKLTSDQSVLRFSCLLGGRNVDCVSAPQGHKELQLRDATVWWFPRPNPYTQDRFAAQIEIDGVIVQSYEENVKRVSNAKETSYWSTSFWVGFPFAYLFFRIWRLRKKVSMNT